MRRLTSPVHEGIMIDTFGLLVPLILSYSPVQAIYPPYRDHLSGKARLFGWLSSCLHLSLLSAAAAHPAVRGWSPARLAVIPAVDIAAQAGVGGERLQRAEAEDEPSQGVEVVVDEEGEGKAQHAEEQAEVAIPAIERQHRHAALWALARLQGVSHAVPETFAQE